MFDGIRVGIDVLGTKVSEKTKRVLAKIGDVFTGVADSDNVEWWQHVGFVSRPPLPANSKDAAQAVVIQSGDRDVAVASCDLRGLELAGNIQPGETCVYASGSDGAAQPRLLMKGSGTVSLFTRDGNVASGQAVAIQANADSTIGIVSKYGAIMIDANGITLSSGRAALVLGADGSIRLQGNGLCEIAGKITCIGRNVLPLPTNTALVGATGPAGVPSTNVYIGI